MVPASADSFEGRPVSHCWDTDPVLLRTLERDGATWLAAKGTSLGADDGIGVALGLALLAEAPCAPCGALELLLTVDEETTMSGAELCPAGFLRATSLINIDSEDEGVVTIGSAGGFEFQALPPTPREPAPQHSARVAVTVRGLSGGHSGVEVHKGRGNAIVILGRLLDAAVTAGARLVTLTAGRAANIIPPQASAVLAVLPSDAEALCAALKLLASSELAVFSTTDPEASIRCELLPSDASEAAFVPLTPIASETVPRLILALPDGVLRASPDVPGLTETSITLAIAKLAPEDDHATLHLHARSSVNPALDGLFARLTALCRVAGVPCSQKQLLPYSGWRPNPASPLLAVFSSACAHVYGKPPSVEAIHAGLEVGLLMGPMPELDAVSVGPTVVDVHSPLEAVHVPSVARTYLLLAEAARRFFSA
jgi:dipeptidase D